MGNEINRDSVVYFDNGVPLCRWLDIPHRGDRGRARYTFARLVGEQRLRPTLFTPFSFPPFIHVELSW